VSDRLAALLHQQRTTVLPSNGRVWNVKQVRKALKKDRFYTSDADGHTADVEKTRCVICNKKTIRTDPNNETDNLLDTLPPCA